MQVSIFFAKNDRTFQKHRPFFFNMKRVESEGTAYLKKYPECV